MNTDRTIDFSALPLTRRDVLKGGLRGSAGLVLGSLLAPGAVSKALGAVKKPKTPPPRGHSTAIRVGCGRNRVVGFIQSTRKLQDAGAAVCDAGAASALSCL